MGLTDFVMGAGERLFGKEESDQERSAKLENHVRRMGLPVEMLQIDVKGDTAIVHGKVESQADKEKIVLTVGNTDGIAKIDDQLEVKKKEPDKIYPGQVLRIPPSP